MPGAARPGALLEVEELRSEFRLRRSTVRAVDGVSFSVRAGECVGLVGESGCGKSTIGLSILRLLPNIGHITGGSVRLEGRDLLGLGEPEMRQVRGNEVAMIFQDPMTSLNPTWTVGRQVAEPVQIHQGLAKAAALQRAVELLALVGVPRPEERASQYPHQLSGGLRQRVMIAMALSCQPKLLIADEPTTALDVTIQAQILDLVDDLRQRFNMAVLLITHDMGVIAARTQRVLVMYAGKIVEAAATEELFSSMHHPYTEALFRSVPRLDQDKAQRLYSVPGLPPDLSSPVAGCRFAPRCRYATEQCTAAEPLLAPGPGPSPAAGPAPAASVAGPLRRGPALASSAAVGEGPHVFACFHPVGTRPAPRTAPRQEVAGSPEVASPYRGDQHRGDQHRGDQHRGDQHHEQQHERYEDDQVLLRLEDVHKEYAVTRGAVLQRVVGTIKAVSGVSFAVRQGETFGLVGESGCGKTTIGRLVVALERPTLGSVHYRGEQLALLRGAKLRRRRQELQLMFQDPYASLDPRMRVRSIVREPLAIQHIGSRREQERRVEEALGEVGLSPKAADLYPHEFSGGQRQRIGLARALVLHPELIVADEPVSALDVSVQAQILNLMRSLQESHGLTYILISHDLAVVRYLADRVGVMYLGKLVEVAPSDLLLAQAAHPYTQGLIGTIPVPDPVVAKRRQRVEVKGELPSALSPPSGCRFRTRCPYAQEICAEEEPALRPFGDGHWAACHFPLQPPLGEGAAATAGAAVP